MLSTFTKQVMDKPMSTWFFGSLAECSSSRSETGSRIAGQEEVPLGQVPKSREGRLKDMQTLNQYIRETWQMAHDKGIIPKNQPPPRELGPDDVKIILAEFYLGSDSRCTGINHDTLATLLPPPHLASLPRRKSHSSKAAKREERDVAPPQTSPQPEEIVAMEAGSGKPSSLISSAPSKLGGKFPGLVASTSPVCLDIARNQEDRKVYLRIYDLLTAFPDRWLDSVIIDAYIHLLHEHCGFKDTLYVNSAEHDPSLSEIAKTPSCYRYIICPLFYRSHWTILFISHPSKRIRYLNSQVVDQRTPSFQTQPFRELFPGYQVSMLTPTRQCDNSSCGVLACLWAYIFLYFDEEEMDRIRCPDIHPFRETILRQLILSYIVLNRAI